MTSNNWDDGQQVTLRRGDDASTEGKKISDQTYGIFLYNSAQNDTDTTVNVKLKNESTSILVPGTTGDKGLASIVFFHGADSRSVKEGYSRGGVEM